MFLCFISHSTAGVMMNTGPQFKVSTKLQSQPLVNDTSGLTTIPHIFLSLLNEIPFEIDGLYTEKF